MGKYRGREWELTELSGIGKSPSPASKARVTWCLMSALLGSAQRPSREIML